MNEKIYLRLNNRSLKKISNQTIMEESKLIADIRNKRLNYYNKILENNYSDQNSKNDEKVEIISSFDKRNSLPVSLVNISEPLSNHVLKNEYPSENNINKSDILNKFFGDKVNSSSNIESKNFQHSLSFDSNSSTKFKNNHLFMNPKLEEFKRVVEDSYAQHVLHKNENSNFLNSPGGYNSKYLEEAFSINNTPRNQNLNNNLIESSRVSFSFNNPDLTFNEIKNQNGDFFKNDDISDKACLETPKSKSNLPCKIPYMSAYNIYNEKVESLKENDQTKQKLNDTNVNIKKPLSSNGSSLTTSPTSVSSSSAESIKKLAVKNTEIDDLNELIISNLNKKDISKFNMPILKQSESEPQDSQSSYRGNANNKIAIHEAKPPETPRINKSANLITFRKNFLTINNNKYEQQSNIKNKNSNEIISTSKQFEKKNSLDEKNMNSFSHLSSANQPFTNNQVNLYTRSNSINEQLIKDQFTWDILFNKESSLVSMNSNSSFSKKKLEPIDRASSKLINSKPTASINSNNNKFSIANKNKNNLNTSNNKIVSKTKNNFNHKTKRKTNKNNIFNYIEDENVAYDEVDEDDDEGCDTFDIFSSDEDDYENTKNIDNVSLNVNNKNNYVDKLDLKIDLGQLSGDEHSLNNTFKNNNEENQINTKSDKQNKDENEDSYNLNDIINSYSNRTQQQVKPDNIPNLCLDLIEDDKSQSVAASLAKSLCKEIDYKKEMEILTKQPINQNYNQSITNQANKLKKNNDQNVNININKPSKLNQVMDIEVMPQTNNFLTATSNSNSIQQPNLRNNSEPLHSSRPGSSIFFHKKIQNFPLEISNSISVPKRPSSAAIIEKDKVMVRKSETKFNEIDKKPIPKHLINFMASTSMNNLNEKQLNESVKKSSKEVNQENLNKQRKVHWITSKSINVRKSFQRPNSAMALTSKISKNKTNNYENSNSKSQLINEEPKINTNNANFFLNYSRLIEIEAKLKSEIETEREKIINDSKTRPSLEQNILSNSKVRLLENQSIFYDSLVSNEKTQDNYNTDENQKLGDQEAYKKLMKDLINKHENIIENNRKENDENFQVDWLSLPDELWLQIFSYLRQVDLMNIGNSCKKFNSLYLDKTLWRKVTMKYKYNMKDEWLDWVGKRRPNELNIIQCSGNITLSAITNMFKNIGNELKSLNLSRCSNEYLSGDNFALQASIRCKNVTCLDLSWTLLSNQTLKLIAESFLRIESINLSGCNMIQEDGFNFLLIQHGEYLKNLEISGCLHFSSNCILNIGVYCRGLERLNISNCHRMTNEAIIEACPNWLKLKHLDLRGIKSVKNNCISVLVRKCVNLESLALADCVHVGDNSVLEISTYKQNIKYLDLNGCKKISDNSARSLANFCSQLEFLNLKGTSITDTGLITIADGKFIKSLVELNLSFLSVSELVIMKLLGNSPNKFKRLKSIHLYGCYNVKHIDDLKKCYGVNHNQNYLTINI